MSSITIDRGLLLHSLFLFRVPCIGLCSVKRCPKAVSPLELPRPFFRIKFNTYITYVTELQYTLGLPENFTLDMHILQNLLPRVLYDDEDDD